MSRTTRRKHLLPAKNNRSLKTRMYYTRSLALLTRHYIAFVATRNNYLIYYSSHLTEQTKKTAPVTVSGSVNYHEYMYVTINNIQVSSCLIIII